SALHAPAASASATVSLHDALPISDGGGKTRVAGENLIEGFESGRGVALLLGGGGASGERGQVLRVRLQGLVNLRLLLRGANGIRSEEHSLNSSHLGISYAVFCLKK